MGTIRFTLSIMKMVWSLCYQCAAVKPIMSDDDVVWVVRFRVVAVDVDFQSSGGSPSEGHNPLRGSPTKIASEGFLEVLRRSLRGFHGAVRGSAGVHKNSSRVVTPCL